MQAEKVIVRDGFIGIGSNREIVEYLQSLYPDRDISVHMLLQGEAHLTLHEKGRASEVEPEKDVHWMMKKFTEELQDDMPGSKLDMRETMLLSRALSMAIRELKE